LVPGFDGAEFSIEWKDALWDKFCTAAPQRQRHNDGATTTTPQRRRHNDDGNPSSDTA
jgi:hypothetical protein